MDHVCFHESAADVTQTICRGAAYAVPVCGVRSCVRACVGVFVRLT